ncbi:uncharacterized protein GGS22DRAFT_199394 [Annulohypoxylon maeteangense]|uniref:uncharacterized protein n=1 Tax=Annulohypoxylon maeteangense TaxID=1927788 RepID=UPI0020089CC3|nr:uncharacterized protein GGS22DRAFT_199394 [Annulohypoxylon maeteangense]KAI0885948.1 hypothetical protein GGS22DRAFT_199394 [Annulohypoxylon maeteangense]
MFSSSAYGHHQGHQPTPLDPKAREFAPVGGQACDPVQDATFITRTIPDIPPGSHVIGLCTVPLERAGMDNLGWHIVDFLAFKYLLHDEVNPGSQDWLAHCDIVGIVNNNPDLYVHGKERRIVLGAEGTGYQGTYYSHGADLKVQTDRQKLMADFLIACSVKAHLSKQSGTPLIIIVCGPSTIEQDVFFGETNPVHHLKSQSICHAIGGDVEAIMVTPSMFSAGWQVNPSFTQSPCQVRADRNEFLARQFGGVFTRSHMRHFVGLACPLLGGDGMNMKEVKQKFSNPFILSDEQREFLADLKVAIHRSLTGRLSAENGNHSFNFETEHDDWEKLIGPRKYLSLEDYRKKWKKLEVSTRIVDCERFKFFGDAFGGNKNSQIVHLKHLTKEAFEAWPAYWDLPASNEAKTVLKKLLDDKDVDENFCHEIFTVAEHRATLTVLGDITIRSLDIPQPTEDRSRDWNEKIDFQVVAAPYNEIICWIPDVFVPPGVNPDPLRAIQKYFDYPVFYLALAVVRYQNLIGGSVGPITERIHGLLKAAKSRQIELLCSVPEVQQKCIVWLKAINMPIRGLEESSAAVSQLEAPTQAAIESDETLIHDAQPQSLAELQGTLIRDMVDGQMIAGLSTEKKTEAEIEDYLDKNSGAREAVDFLLEKDCNESMQSLIGGQRRLCKSLQKAPNDDYLLSMKRDLDYVSQKILNKLEKRERVNAQTNLPPQQQGQPPEEWVAPHLRRKVRNVAETNKENNPGMSSYQGSSSHMEPEGDQSTSNQTSALAPRSPGKKNRQRLDVETLMRRHNRNHGGGC